MPGGFPGRGRRLKSAAGRRRSTSEGQESRTVWVQVQIGGPKPPRVRLATYSCLSGPNAGCAGLQHPLFAPVRHEADRRQLSAPGTEGSILARSAKTPSRDILFVALRAGRNPGRMPALLHIYPLTRIRARPCGDARQGTWRWARQAGQPSGRQEE